MSGLLNVDAILSRRDQKLQEYKKACDQLLKSTNGSLSDPRQQTTTVNIPPPGAILSVVSWNIQTFEAGKSLSNPFVNVVINRILEALSVDICILLETRADSYINMNAIETGDVGSGDWKLSSADDEEAEDNEDDEDADTPDGDDDDDGSNAMSDPGNDTQPVNDDDDDDTTPDGKSTPPLAMEGGEPLRYDQLVSEMTGKRWVPPSRIYVYHPVLVQRAKLAADKVALDHLLNKLKTQAGRSDKTRNSMLKKAAQEKRAEGRKRLDKFLEDNVADQPKKGRKVKLTVKEKNKLLRMYKAYLQDTTRFDPLKNMSQKESKFLTDYNKAPKWNKSDTVIAIPLGPSDQWKQRLLADDINPIRMYYELLYVDDGYNEKVVDNWKDVLTASASENWRFMLHVRSCPTCNKMLGTVACTTVIGNYNGLDIKCEGLGPYTTALENVRQAINSITFYRGSAQESYSLLVRPSTSVSGPSFQGTWLHEKQAQVASISAKLLMRAPSPKQTNKSTTKPVFLAGNMLGYQDGSSKFYGRCPFSVLISMWLPSTGAREDMRLVAFHGPYGKSDKAGVEARAASMRELMKADGASDGTTIQDCKNALIMGDFNLDYSPGSQKTQEQIANNLYEGFNKLGFVPMVQGGVATSLISIHGKTQAWKNTNASASSNFTSSAYDNMFLKGDLVHKHHVTSAVIDVISWIEANISDFDLPAHLERPDGYDLLPAKTKAFYIYHRFVSDHLPIICDILVQGRDDESLNAQKAKALKQVLLKQSAEQQKPLSFDAVLAYESVLDISLTETQQDSYTKEEGTSRYANIVGTIVGHQDSHLVIQCTPQSGLGSAWVTFLPELEGKPISGRLQQKFLEAYPVGKRVEMQLLNPRWLPLGS